MNFQEYKKKKKHNTRVSPGFYNRTENGQLNDSYEMDSVDEEKANNKTIMERFRLAAHKVGHNPINVISNIKASANKWRKYSTFRRTASVTFGGNSDMDRRKTGGMGLDFDLGSVPGKDTTDGKLSLAQQQMMVAHNRNLVEYFARLGQSKEEDDAINLEYVESLLNSGAQICCTDKYGQTVLHEVARAWHVDVAKFLIEHGAHPDQADNYGRTPLHVAAAVDYPEMVNFLIKVGANKEAETKGEHQTPVHFAARNDACMSLKALIKNGCQYKCIRDYKGRTPLHLAAELDRSETARTLLEVNDPAPAGVEDDSCQAAIVWMITKMPPVAKQALDQFHTTDRANRKQYYHLHRLEPRKPDDDRPVFPQKALQVIVRYHQHELILHAAVQRLITIKWQRFGKLGTWINTLINLVFIILWSMLGILVEYDQRHIYILPQQWWRLLLFILAAILTVWQIKEELSEFFTSRKKHKDWSEWRRTEIERDIEFSHPRWPEEEQYLRSEINELDKMRPQYFNDFWNIFDWICYFLLLVCIVTHIVDIISHSNFIARFHIRIMAATIILIWLRLMKNARAFSTLGPFIVMISHMIGDCVKFAFLYLEFFIPFACAFWMIFGGDKVPEQYQGLPAASNNTVSVGGMQTFNALMFSLFRLTLVDEYDYETMKLVDSLMADLLVASWLALSAILMLNLFIALMSDTFQRVHDNAQANAVMQKAITILNIEENMSMKRRKKFRTFIHTKCAPEEDFYDDDSTSAGGEDLKKVTIQIKEQLDEVQEDLKLHQHSKGKHEKQRLGDPNSSNRTLNSSIGDGEPVTRALFDNEIDQLRDEIQQVQDQQHAMYNRFKRDMSTVKLLLQQLVASQIGTGHSGSINVVENAPIPAVNQQPTHMMSRDNVDNLFQETSYGADQERDFEDIQWERMERKRRQDLKQLRHQLLQQQAAASQSQGLPLSVEVSEQRVEDEAEELSVTDVNQLAFHHDSPKVKVKSTVAFEGSSNLPLDLTDFTWH